MKVQVTERHIQSGVMRDVRKCPFALAIKEHLWSDCDVVVYATVTVSYPYSPTKLQISETKLSKDLLRWELAFDRGQTVSPIEFEIDVPSEFLKDSPHEQKEPFWKRQWNILTRKYW